MTLKNHQYIYVLLIPFCLYTYLVILFTSSIKPSGELFPFFSWSLFSSPPKHANPIFINIHSINGLEPETHKKFLSAANHPKSTNIRKALYSVNRTCIQRKHKCEDMIEDVVFPMITEVIGNQKIQFSIIYCNIDFIDVKNKFLSASTKIPIFTPLDCNSRFILGPFTLGN